MCPLQCVRQHYKVGKFGLVFQVSRQSAIFLWYLEKRNKELGESCEKLLPTTYIINMTFNGKFIFAIRTICIISLAYAGNYCVGQKNR